MRVTGFFRVRLFLSLALSFLAIRASALGPADTLSVMSYNVLNYGFPATASCPMLLTAAKHGYLKTILRYSKPDILALLKMNADPSAFSTDTVVHAVLDSVCDGCYYHCLFTNNSGYGKENMLYFRNEKFGFISSTVIYAADPNISDITLHRLFYKYPDGTAGLDSMILNVLVVHLKSGAGNDQNRADEVQGALNWMQANITQSGNYLLMGDLNTQSSTENGYQLLVNNPNANIRFIDPVNMPGNWAANPGNYSHFLTSDTRTADIGDCGAANGMGMRYQHILATAPLMTGSLRMKYLAGSYTTVGQDGLHTGLALSDMPVNNVVPADVNQALFAMSNHLPVSMRIVIDTLASSSFIKDVEHQQSMDWNSLMHDQLRISVKSNQDRLESFSLSLTDMYGAARLQLSGIQNKDLTLDVSKFDDGIYILKIITSKGYTQYGKLLKVSYR